MEQILIRRLESISSAISKLTEEALTYKDNVNTENSENLEIVLGKLNIAVKRFGTELNNSLSMNELQSFVEEVTSFSEVQLRGEEVLTEMNIKLKRIKENSTPTVLPSKNTALIGKLPKLSLPEFSGDILEWRQFWDQFCSNVGNRDLSEVDKLLYLKGSLKGEAKKVIEGLETTNKNYEIAVSVLKNRYGKENHIIDAHYAALYKVPKASKGNVTEARNTFDQIEKHLRILKSLSQNVDHNHLRFMILEKMPSDIVYELKIKAKTESIEEIRQHLEIIIAAREDANRITSENLEEYTTQTLHTSSYNRRENFEKPNKNYKNFEKHNLILNRQGNRKEEKFNEIKPFLKNINYNSEFKRRKPQEQQSDRDMPMRKKERIQCIFCQGPHFNDQCNVVKTVKERKEKLKNHCFVCLKKGHTGKYCRSSIPCVHCKTIGWHNRALCEENCMKKTENVKT